MIPCTKGDTSDGNGSDTFVWRANEQGSSTDPAQDSVFNFYHLTDGNNGGDVLDLRDLLHNEENNPLTDYLSFASDGMDTTIHIDPNGVDAFQGSQEIIIKGEDLTTGGTLTDHDIIEQMIANNNLLTD